MSPAGGALSCVAGLGAPRLLPRKDRDQRQAQDKLHSEGSCGGPTDTSQRQGAVLRVIPALLEQHRQRGGVLAGRG